MSTPGDLGALGINASEDRVDTGEGRMRGSFHAVSERGRGRLVATVVRGDAGNVLGVAALGAPDADTALDAFIDEIVASARWSAPAARTLAAQAAGAILRSTSGASASSEKRDAHQGRWVLVGDLAGRIWLALEPADRDDVVFEVKLAGDGTATLNGAAYAVGPAGR